MELIFLVAPDFKLDELDSARRYVSLLLGGGENLWSNVDFAAAFGTCVTGNPVVAHITDSDIPVAAQSDRQHFPEIAAILRPGLRSVVTDGTATQRLGKEARAFLQSMSGAHAYAKTGTLRTSTGEESTSRIVLALVRWSNEKRGDARKGLVISVVAERGSVGTAAGYLGQ